MSDWNPPPWRGASETPMQRFNRQLGQAFVNAGQCLATMMFGTTAEKRAVVAWMERNRQGKALELPEPMSELDLALRHMRVLGDRHMQVAKAHLAIRMTAMYDEFGLETQPMTSQATQLVTDEGNTR